MEKEKAYELVERFRALEAEKKELESRLEKAIAAVIDEESKKNPTKPVWESGSARMFIMKKSDLLGDTWAVEGCVWTESAEVLKEVLRRSGPVNAIERFRNILSKSKNGVCTVEFRGGTLAKWWTLYNYKKIIDARYLKAVIERLTKPC